MSKKMNVLITILGVVFLTKVLADTSNTYVSQSGIDFIKRHESLSLTRYVDASGLAHIGYGHLIKPGENLPNRITKKQAENLLRNDLKTAAKAVRRSVRVPLSIDQHNALVSLAYNIGEGAFTSSTLVKKLNTGNYQEAAQEFLKWNKIKGRPNKGLSDRRMDEMIMFLRKTK